MRFGSVAESWLQRKFENEKEVKEIIDGITFLSKASPNSVKSLALIDELTLDYDEYFERERAKFGFGFLRDVGGVEDLEIAGKFSGAFCGLDLTGIYDHGSCLRRLVLCLEDHLSDLIVVDLRKLAEVSLVFDCGLKFKFSLTSQKLKK